MTTKLGHISKVGFGFGGYDDAMFGLTVSLQGESWGVKDFKGWWAVRPETAQWSKEEGVKIHAETMLFILDLLKAAKKKDVTELKGVPVEVTFDGQRLQSWRILTEVIS